MSLADFNIESEPLRGCKLFRKDGDPNGLISLTMRTEAVDGDHFRTEKDVTIHGLRMLRMYINFLVDGCGSENHDWDGDPAALTDTCKCKKCGLLKPMNFQGW